MTRCYSRCAAPDVGQLFLISLVGAALLVGCGAPEPTSTPRPTSVPTPTVPPGAADEITQIRIQAIAPYSISTLTVSADRGLYVAQLRRPAGAPIPPESFAVESDEWLRLLEMLDVDSLGYGSRMGLDARERRGGTFYHFVLIFGDGDETDTLCYVYDLVDCPAWFVEAWESVRALWGGVMLEVTE